MFYHPHPYAPFIPPNAHTLIVGTLPPPRFVHKELYPDDVDFCYGSNKGLLWPILERVFDVCLSYENSETAIAERKQLLHEHQIGICDVVASCYRSKIDASDIGMQQVELRDLLYFIKQNPTVKTLLFTGGNSKNGPEYFFRKLLKSSATPLHQICDVHPRTHQFTLASRRITTVSLMAPSGAANRAVGSNPDYKRRKLANPAYTTFDFRVDQYRPYFLKF